MRMHYLCCTQCVYMYVYSYSIQHMHVYMHHLMMTSCDAQITSGRWVLAFLDGFLESKKRPKKSKNSDFRPQRHLSTKYTKTPKYTYFVSCIWYVQRMTCNISCMHKYTKYAVFSYFGCFGLFMLFTHEYCIVDASIDDVPFLMMACHDVISMIAET